MKPLAQNTLIQNRYLIVQLIGKGGMGEVYLAVDQRLGSAVAIKRTFFAGDEMLGNAFEREARVLARLRHPVLPKVSDHLTENDQQFLVMEHISGDDLSKRLEGLQKPFPLSWVMFWADQLLDALSYLHSHEPPIIHRDIKPQNLKLTDENHIVLLDFGLSKSSTGQTNLASGIKSGSTGSVVGYTPHYAPMEQIRGIGTSPRSDLYSLSATLYQLLTNVVPADALSRADSMLNGLQDPITPISQLNTDVPQAVSEVILRGMEVSQDKRFESAREMQKTLRKAFAEMQQAMSAKTMVISGVEVAAVTNSQTPSFDATEVMDPESLRSISNPSANIAGGFSENVSQPQTSPHADMDATVAFDPGTIGQAIQQSSVKTEVFVSGADLLPTPPRDSQPYVSSPTPPAAEHENFALTTDYSNLASPASDANDPPGEGFFPDATMPIIALDNNGTSAMETANGGVQYTGHDQAVSTHAAYDSQPQQRAAAVSPPAKKKGSTGKIVALLGGLFLFFVVVLGAAGGGYYYYTNYMGAAVDPTPSPTPLPTLEPSPSPTLNVVDNTNASTPTPSPSPSATPEPTATPFDDPSEQPQNDRPHAHPPVNNRPITRPPANKSAARPGPTKKPGGAPDILQ